MSEKFLSSKGFVGNPFSSTNADKEPQLTDYFVPPPYFPSVRGDPRDPKSNVVLAPRGGGKTAQKVMLEEYSREEKNAPIFCITYDSFQTPQGFKLSSVNSDWHLSRIVQRFLGGVCALIEDGHGTNLSKADKRTIAYCIEKYLGKLSADDANDVVSSIKSIPEKTNEFFITHGRNIAAIMAAIAAKLGLNDLDLDFSADEDLRTESHESIFNRLITIVQNFGYSCVYILIDRVDEAPIVNGDSGQTHRLIKPLMANLHLLETPNSAFKFFLWDQIEDELRGSGDFRADRVPIFQLIWTQQELEQMLSKRLAAFSNHKITHLNQVCSDDLDFDLHKLVCFLGNGSPRDVIRLAASILDEHTRRGDTEEPLTRIAIAEGIKKFSSERSGELYANFTNDLRRIGTSTFTIGYLSSEVFKIGNQGARNKVQNWQRVGAVVKSGEIPNPPNRPLYEYSISDIRLAIAAQGSQPVFQTLTNYCHICPGCEQVLVRGSQDISCHKCSTEFQANEETNILSYCRL